MKFETNSHLRGYLVQAGRVSDLAFESFDLDDAEFEKHVRQVKSQHPYLNAAECQARAAFRCIAAPKSKSEPPPKVKKKLGVKFWLIVAGIIAAGLLAGILAHAEPTPQNYRAYRAALKGFSLYAVPQQPSGLIIQLRDEGVVQATRPAGLVAFDCVGSGLACTSSGNVWTLTASGGAGTGCTPPGGAGQLLYDDGAGGCANITKFSSNGTTTITGAATAIFDLSAAATFKPPQVTAPTVEGTSAFNTTSHLPVWGFNGASTTTIPTTLANAAHKWLNSYDQTTGALTQTQPDYSDLSGVPSTFAPSAHNLLSASHGDTVAASPVRGDILIANSTPAWTKLALGAATSGKYAKSNGTDVVLSSGSASGTGTPTACSNQVVTALTLNADAAPTSTCTTITTAFLPGSGATTVNGQTCTLGSTCTIPLSAVNPQTGTYQVLAADFSNYKTITVASGTFTITLVASGSQPAAGQYIQIINYGSGVVTVARSGQNINGAAGNFTLSAGSATAPTSTFIESDGTNYFAAIDEGTLGTVTSVATTSPIGGGTITGTGTITCTTCATTTNGGALSGTSPVAISAAGAISCATCATTTNGGALSGTSPVTVSAAGAIGCATCTVTVASGTKALATGAISSGACTAAQTATATGTLTTDTIMSTFNADPTGVTGYAASTNGGLFIYTYPTADTANWKVCNNTSASITPGAITLNFRVVR